MFDKHMGNEAADPVDISSVIDVESGMARVINNKKLYYKLLGSCNIREMAEELIAAVKNKEEEAVHFAHKMKGVAANLSLDALLKAVIDIEMRLKAGIEADSLIENLSTAAELTVKVIAQLLEEGEI